VLYNGTTHVSLWCSVPRTGLTGIPFCYPQQISTLWYGLWRQISITYFTHAAQLPNHYLSHTLAKQNYHAGKHHQSQYRYNLFVLILLYVHHETNYDKFNEHFANIYRLEGDNYAKLPPSIGLIIKDRVPEVENIARIADMGVMEIARKSDNKAVNLVHIAANVVWADSTTFKVFSLAFVKGDPATALTRPHTVVLAEHIARGLFGDENPIGESVVYDDSQYIVTGVIKEVEKSHISMEALFSLSSLALVFPDRDLNMTGGNAWLWSATYLLADENVQQRDLEQKISGVLSVINNGKLFDTVFKTFRLRPLEDIYFHGALQSLDYGVHGSARMISILYVIGLFMMLLAVINYINLTTARAGTRFKEVGVKLIVGSTVLWIRMHLILESIIISVIALAVALTFTQLFLGQFNEVAMVNIRLAEFNHLQVWITVAACILLLGMMAGVYPAIYITAVKPLKLMKGSWVNKSDAVNVRSVLMTAQFTLSIVLIVCAIANLEQLSFIRNADLGFKKEQIVLVETSDVNEDYTLRQSVKNELLRIPGVVGVTNTAGNPGGAIPTEPLTIEGQTYTMELMLVDHDFFDVMGVEMVQGKSFSPKTTSDYPEHEISDHLYVIVNEAFVREIGIASPVGRLFYWTDGGKRKAYEVIGVAKDFHVRSFHHKINPLILIQTPPMHTFNIKLQASNIPATLKSIEAEWRMAFGERIFSYRFLDEIFDRQYKSDSQLATIIVWFTGLALVVACLGLFALTSFIISRRIKEIGIRKTMGASIESIYLMLSWDFLKWIVLAVMIGCPASWFLVQRLWLDRFAYHITLGPDIFIIATLLIATVSLLTVTWQSFRAANANPVKSLRYE
jgi:putative ABC transport system permease protein